MKVPKKYVILVTLLINAFFSSLTYANNIYSYDKKNGRCSDSGGAVGLNTITVKDLIASGNGECADLRGATIPGGNSLLAGFNLKGADLTNVKLDFAHLDEADLDGALLIHIDLDGYSSIGGNIDQYTKLPILGDRLRCKTVDVSTIYCM